jgi:hypothetical protein
MPLLCLPSSPSVSVRSGWVPVGLIWMYTLTASLLYNLIQACSAWHKRISTSCECPRREPIWPGLTTCLVKHSACCFWQVLEQVYLAQDNIDDDLVNSIVWPAQHPNAAEAFYRIITGKGTPVNWLLKELDKVGVLLLKSLQRNALWTSMCPVPALLGLLLLESTDHGCGCVAAIAITMGCGGPMDQASKCRAHSWAVPTRREGTAECRALPSGATCCLAVACSNVGSTQRFRPALLILTWTIRSSPAVYNH